MKLSLKNIVIIGCCGAIGAAFTKLVAEKYPYANIHAFSRKKPTKLLLGVSYYEIDYTDEHSIESSAAIASKEQAIDLIIIATGVLHTEKLMPEKSISDISLEKLQTIFEINTFFPALIMKHFLAKLNKHKVSIFVALSTRVGNISDNFLGGWYAYRSSKAALNMLIKTASIESTRKNKNSIVVGLHPGTVDSHLSKPFQKNIKNSSILTPENSAQKLLYILENITLEQSGKCLDLQGKEVHP